MPRKPRYSKVSKGRYFTAAFEHLANSSVDSLTITVLCSGLGVTSGSFYHHFGSWMGFVMALLDHWEGRHADHLAALVNGEPDPEQRLRELSLEAVALPDAVDVAIRAWGRSDDLVLVAVDHVDARRHAVVQDALVALGAPSADAKHLATAGLALFIGFQQLGRPTDPAILSGLFEQFAHAISARAGRPATNAHPRPVRSVA